MFCSINFSFLFLCVFFLLLYILQDGNMCLRARYPSFPFPHLLSTYTLVQEPDSMNYINMLLPFHWVQQVDSPRKQRQEESEVRTCISLVPTTCKIYSGWMCPFIESHLLFLRQLLGRPFVFRVNFFHLLGLGMEHHPCYNSQFGCYPCVSSKLHLPLSIYFCWGQIHFELSYFELDICVLLRPLLM